MSCFTEVLSSITPRQTAELTFVGDSLMPQQRIFGGQVVAQCLMAANQTVGPELSAHSLHAYFLRAGDPATDRFRGRPHPRRTLFLHPAGRRTPEGRGDL